MKFLITKRKSTSVTLVMGALLTCALITGACTGNNVKSDPSNKEASADKPQFEPPKVGEPYYKSKPLPKGPEVIADYKPNRQPKADVIEPVQENSGPITNIKRSALNTFIKKGPRHALKVVSVQPAFQGSRFIGYQVVGFSKDSGGIKSVLKTGDIVTAVNNKNIVRPEDYMAAWESLKTCENVSIKITRQGEKVELSWPVTNVH